MSSLYQEKVLPTIAWFNERRILSPDFFHQAAHTAISMANGLPWSRELGLIERFAEKGERFVDPALQIDFMGVRAESPFGTGAGWDKKGTAARGLYRLGSAWVAVGSIKPFKEQGNGGPVLWVDCFDCVAQNHYGMPSPGAEKVAQNLSKRRGDFPIVGNLAVPKNAKPEDAPGIFKDLVKSLHRVVEIFEVNFSCPNQDDMTGKKFKMWNE